MKRWQRKNFIIVRVIVATIILCTAASASWAAPAVNQPSAAVKQTSQQNSPIRSPAQGLASARPVRPVRSATVDSKKKMPSDYFSRAKAYFAVGQYQKALIYASADLRQNPTRKASIIVMAQSYYRIGQAGRAAKLFLLISPAELSSDAAVEYTLSMFASRRFTQATHAWQRIALDHPYRDVARFYAGVSYMNLSLYNKAAQLLRSAIKLPANLKSDRRRLLNEVNDLLNRQKSGDFTANQAYSYQTQSRNYQITPSNAAPEAPAAPGTPAAPAVAAEKKPAASSAKSGFSYSATPTFSYASTSSKKDFNGYKQQQSSSTSPSVSMPMQMKYLGRPRSFGGQPSITISVTPTYEDSEGTTKTTSLEAPDDNPTAVQAKTDTSDDHSFDAKIANAIDVLYPISDPVDLGFGYSDRHTYTDASQKLDREVSGPNAEVIYENGRYKTDLTWSMLSTTDTDKTLPSPKINTVSKIDATITRNGETSVSSIEGTYTTTDAADKDGEQTRTAAEISWEKTWDDLTLGLTGDYVMRTPYVGTTLTSGKKISTEPGRTNYEGGFSLKWTLSFGLAVTGAFNHTQFEQFESLIENSMIQSSGTVETYGISGSIAIGSYINVEGAYNYKQLKMTVSDPAYESTILKPVCSQSTDTSIKLGVKYPL